ncbi:pyridine nucleotide-disulfide oxidoreductase [Hyphococcus luteus]|uniref:Pyridine nucleotide-disulfide oxidoreductase n=1 Tax=Hyphococcus luteus TaxID=2058213 RepID=A0A2S7K222_9PROT|nr:pyridine nucleotide-disulfide oxidoreductase [Marinicaulis flavus]PQA86552.1 pyridine nucleotide-disulfide oxidoreductase [Marinicaulis flavus]
MQVILKEQAAGPASSLGGEGRPAGRRRAPARKKAASWGSVIFGLLIAGALGYGWRMRDRWIEAEAGLGYYLGIAGAIAMLLLLTYPLRKNSRLLQWAGPVSFWFRLHMALGLIGPTLILYHANFGLGSTNSNVALAAMLIVASSGLIGRFFYAKIHRGLYGKRAEARELVTEAGAIRDRLSVAIDDDLKRRIDDLEAAAFESSAGMGAAAVKAFAVVSKARALKGKLSKQLKSSPQLRGRQKALTQQLDFSARYFSRIEQAAELAFYERLFAAWHVLHLPLFILLIITAIIHVVAVHLY